MFAFLVLKLSGCLLSARATKRATFELCEGRCRYQGATRQCGQKREALLLSRVAWRETLLSGLGQTEPCDQLMMHTLQTIL